MRRFLGDLRRFRKMARRRRCSIWELFHSLLEEEMGWTQLQAMTDEYFKDLPAVRQYVERGPEWLPPRLGDLRKRRR